MHPKSRQALVLATLLLLPSSALTAETQKDFVLGGESGQNGTRRVKLKYEAAGKLTVQQNGQAAKPLDMTLTAEQDFLERLLPADDKLPLAVRRYEAATANITLGETKRDFRLADAHRLIVVHEVGARAFACATGSLTSDEVELLDAPGASVAIDRLLPLDPVQVGQSWNHSDELAADLLGLDAVSASSLRSTLREIKDDVARIELSGAVHGAEQGVATEVEVKARYTASLRGHRVTWVGLVLKEKRAAGAVTAGLEATSRLTMTVAGGEEVPELSTAALADAVRRAAPDQPLRCERPGQFELTFDRSWHEVAEHERLLVLRLVDRGELLAQCNIAELEQPKPGEDSLAAFEGDVKRLLGESFERVEDAKELPHAAGYRVLRVVASGKTDELPIRWIYYRVRDEQGRQAALVFTVEQQHLERFDAADQKLIASFRFSAPAAVAAQPKPKRAK